MLTQSSTVTLGEATRTPPAAKDAEKAILGTIMLHARMPNVDTLDVATGIISPEAFYMDNTRTVYRTILELSKKGRSYDEVTVLETLRANGELDYVGGAYFLMSLGNAVVSDANFETHCRVVQQCFMSREMIRVGAKIHNDAYDQNGDVFDQLAEAEKGILGIGGAIVQDAIDMDTALVQTLRQIEEWRKRDSSITGIPSGFPQLDRVTRGWQPGNLIILAARPSVGKTAMALQLARMAAKAGYPTAIFSLEMSRVSLVLRLLSAEGEMNLARLQTGRLDDMQMKELHKEGLARLSKMPIYIDDGPELSIYLLGGKLRRMKKKRKIKFAIVDYLQLMTGTGQTREQEISSISRGLKKLSKELDIPIVALSQLSREIEKRPANKKAPQLSDLRESGAIEQDADMVTFLWGPDDEDIIRDPGLYGKRHFKIAKARDGVLAQVLLDFQGDIQVFKETPTLTPVKNLPESGGYKPVTTETLF